MLKRFNLFTVLFFGGIVLFLYCLGSVVVGEFSSAIEDPIGYFQKLHDLKDQDYTIFDFLGLLLDQLI